MKLSETVIRVCRGRGVAAKAVSELVRVAFLRPNVQEVFAETAADNDPSQRVVEKAGFRQFGERDTADDGIVYQWLRARQRHGGPIPGIEVVANQVNRTVVGPLKSGDAISLSTRRQFGRS